MNDNRQSNSVETPDAIREAVKALPEDSLSLAWRSDLNERLRAMGPQVRRRAWFWHFGRPALGLSLAGCLALMVTLRMVAPQTGTGVGVGIEDALIQTVAETTRVRDVTGAGLLPQELNETTRIEFEEEWSELDLGAL